MKKLYQLPEYQNVKLYFDNNEKQKNRKALSIDNSKLERNNKELHSIIKEVREYIENNNIYSNKKIDDILEILDKAGRETNSSIGTIQKCCVGINHTCNGYKWRYADE